MLLVPSNRKDIGSPACLQELVPKLPVGLAPALERASGGHARIYVGEDGSVTLDGDWHLDVEIQDASAGAVGVERFGSSLGLVSSCLKQATFSGGACSRFIVNYQI